MLAPASWSQSVPAPTFSPSSGSAFVDVTPVTVSDTGAGVTIHYTTDGLAPTAGDPVIASGSSIRIGAGLILKACAFNGSGSPSAVTSGTYQITGLIEGGSYHGIAIDFSGKLWAWGAQGMGRLGNGSTTTGVNVLTPGRVEFSSTATFDNAISASAGNGHSLAVDSSGKVWAFGGNADYQLGNNTTTDSAYAIPVLTGTGSGQYLTGMTDVSASFDFSFATGTSGGVWAWGDNTSGRTGVGTTAGYQKFAAPVLSTTGTLGNIVEVASSGVFGLALDGTGAVWAWGDNTDGAIGVSGSTSQTKAVKVVWTGTGTPFSGVTDIAAGWEHGMAVVWNGSNSGTVWCWGEQGNGRLGNGQNAAAVIKTPVEVTCTNGATLTNIVQVAAGPRHSLALDGTGAVWAWGYNATGDLGNGNTTTGLNAAHVSLPEAMLTIGAGGYDDGSGTIQAFSYAIGVSGKFYAWGYDAHGELADGETTTEESPEVSATSVYWYDKLPVINSFAGYPTSSEPAPVVLSATASSATNLLASLRFYDGTGALLSSTTGGSMSYTTPALSTGTYNYKAVAVDSVGGSVSATTTIIIPLQTMSVTTSTPSIAEGGTGYFTISRGATDPTTIPITVTFNFLGTAVEGVRYQPTSTVVTIPIGQSSVSVPIVSNTDNIIEGLQSVILTLTPGQYNISAGENSAQINIDDPTGPPMPLFSQGGYTGVSSTVPIVITCSSTSAVIHYTMDGITPTQNDPIIASGSSFFPLSSGTLEANAWLPGDAPSATNSDVFNFTGAITGGAGHSLAIRSDGTVWAWGLNSFGQLGDLTEVDRFSPVQVMKVVGSSTTALTNIVSISAGSTRSMALDASGNAYTWGGGTPYATLTGTAVNAIALSSSDQAVMLTGTYKGSVVCGADLSDSNSYQLWDPASGPYLYGKGSNGLGQLTGNSASYSSFTFCQISSGVYLAAGPVATCYEHSASIVSGTIYVWGDLNSTAFDYATPVSSGTLYTALATNALNILGLQSNGALSEATLAYPGSMTFTSVGLSGSAVAIGEGLDHQMAILSDGSVWTWGNNIDGQLGDGSTSVNSSSSQIPGFYLNYWNDAAGDGVPTWQEKLWGGNPNGTLGSTYYDNGTPNTVVTEGVSPFTPAPTPQLQSESSSYPAPSIYITSPVNQYIP